MRSYDEKSKERYAILERAYELAQGNRTNSLHVWSIIGPSSLDPNEADNALDYLEQEGPIMLGPLQRNNVNSQMMTITHKGIIEIEQSKKEPTKSTEHFQLSVFNIGSAMGNSFQVGTSNSTQTTSNTLGYVDPEPAKAWMCALRSQVRKFGLSEHDTESAMTLARTAELALSEAHLDKQFLAGTLQRIELILNRAVAGTAGENLLQNLRPILEAL